MNQNPSLPAYFNGLNPPQKEAAQTVDGPLIVLAGAGSGKTRMLTARIAFLMDHVGVRPYQILAVTFTNKAAAEMRERVFKHLELAQARGYLGTPEIGTFHSVCVRILRQEMATIGFTKPFVIYDDSDQLSLIRTVMDRLGLDTKQTNPKSIRAAINIAKCEAKEPQDIEVSTFDRFSKLLKEVYFHYQKELFNSNALDFGEIICATYRLLRDHPILRAKYQQKFRYIHVDEYQDTNRAQYLLLAMLCQPEYGGHGNLCVVGDEDQSIYKWRGADIQNILDFERDFPGAAIVKLEQNYRSTQTIISAASELISHNTERKNKKLWTENPAGEKINRIQFLDERAEAEKVVAETQRLVREGYDLDDFAVFYRTHAQSRQFEDVLGRERLPYQIVGGLRFYDRKEIKDILAYFRVIMNPADGVSLMRIINTPARGLGKTTLTKLQGLVSEPPLEAAATGLPWDFWAALNFAATSDSLFNASTRKKLEAFTAVVSRWMQDQPQLLLTDLYHRILDETGYVQELRNESTPEAEARIENLEELDTILQEFEEETLNAIAEPAEREAVRPVLLMRFLERATLVSEEEQTQIEAGERGSAFRLMTLHGSKGLEFPVVFMVGMEEGLFPSNRPWEETPPEEIEEERRLCYVGMTRARERLYMTHVLSRRIWGSTHYQEPARFFSEISEDFIHFQDLARVAGAAKGQSFSRTEAASFDSFSQEPEDEAVGRRMEHPEYGRGVVIALEGGGDQQKVVIEFASKARRKFLLRYVASYFE